MLMQPVTLALWLNAISAVTATKGYESRNPHARSHLKSRHGLQNYEDGVVAGSTSHSESHRKQRIRARATLNADATNLLMDKVGLQDGAMTGIPGVLAAGDGLDYKIEFHNYGAEQVVVTFQDKVTNWGAYGKAAFGNAHAPVLAVTVPPKSGGQPGIASASASVGQSYQFNPWSDEFGWNQLADNGYPLVPVGEFTSGTTTPLSVMDLSFLTAPNAQGYEIQVGDCTSSRTSCSFMCVPDAGKQYCDEDPAFYSGTISVVKSPGMTNCIITSTPLTGGHVKTDGGCQGWGNGNGAAVVTFGDKGAAGNEPSSSSSASSGSSSSSLPTSSTLPPESATSLPTGSGTSLPTGSGIPTSSTSSLGSSSVSSSMPIPPVSSSTASNSSSTPVVVPSSSSIPTSIPTTSIPISSISTSSTPTPMPIPIPTSSSLPTSSATSNYPVFPSASGTSPNPTNTQIPTYITGAAGHAASVSTSTYLFFLLVSMLGLLAL